MAGRETLIFVRVTGSLDISALKVKGWSAAVVGCGLMAGARAQESADLPSAPTPHVVVEKVPGGVVVEQAKAGTLPLSLDEAISFGLKHNLQLELTRQNQRMVHGQ